MIEYRISHGGLGVFRSCPDCEAFLVDHPTLVAYNLLTQKRRKDDTWYHTSPKGRILHSYVENHQGSGL